MKSYDADQPIIYTHIPKCAGTSVVQLLRKWFGAAYHKLNQDESKDILLPKAPTQDEQGRWLPTVKCIHGHFNHGRGYGLPYYYPEVTQYFTILRDPFDLVTSMYFFAKGRSARGEFWHRGERVDFGKLFPTVADYLRSYPYWLYHHLPQDITLDNYREKLAERFVAIGIFEDMPHTLAILARALRQPYQPLPQLNVSEYNEPVPFHLRERFYSDYPLLKGVYDFALANHRRLVDEVGPLPPVDAGKASAS